MLNIAPMDRAAGRAKRPQDYGTFTTPEKPALRRVLLVDNRPIMHELFRCSLEYDYDVHACADALEALEIFKTIEFDAVITELAVPGMSGPQLCAEIKKLKPHMPVILLTGFRPETTPEMGAADTFETVIYKPFQPSLLRRTLAECVASA